MLQTLDGDERVAYALGEILELDQVEAAEALGISRPAFRKRLSRARKRLNDVLASTCGIADESNDCRCAKRRKPAMALGRLESQDAVPIDIQSLSTMVRSIDNLGRVAAYFRADPMMKPSEQLLPAVRRIVHVT